MKRITDKMRLDWFSRKGHGCVHWPSGGIQVYNRDGVSETRTTIRKAIDAAIAASKRGRGK